MDGNLTVNLTNFITVALMAFIGVWVLNKIFARFMPSLAATPQASS